MNNFNHPSALILAGGAGTRLRSVVEDRPKVMAEVCGRPFLEYLLDQLVKWQIREVVLCTGYLAEQIEARFGTIYRGLKLAYSREHAALGTAGALRLALPMIRSTTTLVLNGDSFCGFDFESLWHWHQSRKSKATLVLVQNPDASRFGSVQIGADGRIFCFAEKMNSGKPGLINAGIYLIESERLQAIPEAKFVSLEKDLFPEWVGSEFYGFETRAPFLDIGTPESYAAAQSFFTDFKVAGT